MALSKITNASVADTAVHGRRNLIINGSTNVWQKGSSGLTINGSQAGMDRFFAHGGGTASRQSFTVGQTDVPHEPEYFCRHTSTGTANGFHQKIENVRTGAGQTITFTFWAKANKSTTVNALFRQRFGSSGSSTNFDDQNSKFTLTTSWQKFETQKTLDSISGKTIGAGSFLEVGIYHNSGAANDYIDFTQVQVELGDKATPFEHRSYGEELLLCQRYYQKYWSAAYSYNLGPVGYCYGDNEVAMGHNLVTSMRAVPTVSELGTLTIRGGVNNNLNQGHDMTLINNVNGPTDGDVKLVTFTANTNNNLLQMGSLACLANGGTGSNNAIIYDAEL